MAKNLYLTFPGHGYLSKPVDTTEANGLDSVNSTANITMGGTNLGSFDSQDVGSRLFVTGLTGAAIADGYYTLIGYNDSTDVATIKGAPGSISFDGDQGLISGKITVEDFYKFSLGEAPDFVTGQNAKERWVECIALDTTNKSIGYSYDYLGGISAVDGIKINMVYNDAQAFSDLIKYTLENILDPNALENLGPDSPFRGFQYRNVLTLKKPVGVAANPAALSAKIDEFRDKTFYAGKTTFQVETTGRLTAENIRDYVDWGYSVEPEPTATDPNPYNNHPVWIGQEAIQLLSADYDDINEDVTFTCRRAVLGTLGRTHIPGQSSPIMARFPNIQSQRVFLNVIDYDSDSYNDELKVFDGYVTGIQGLNGSTLVSIEIGSLLTSILANKKQESANYNAAWAESYSGFAGRGDDSNYESKLKANVAGSVAIGQDYVYVSEDTESQTIGQWRWIKVKDIALKLRGNPIKLAEDPFGSLVNIGESTMANFLAGTDYNRWNFWEAYDSSSDINADNIKPSPYQCIYAVDRIIINKFNPRTPDSWEISKPYDVNNFNAWDNGVILKGFDSFDEYKSYSRYYADPSRQNNEYRIKDFTLDQDEMQSLQTSFYMWPSARHKQNIPEMPYVPPGNEPGVFELDKEKYFSAISPVAATSKEVPVPCHVFEPIDQSELTEAGGVLWTSYLINDKSPSSLQRRDDSYVIPIHLGELLLQLLTSTEGIVGGSSNGRFDVLPPGIGFGIPQENIDFDSFLDPDLPILLNVFIEQKNIPKISEWIEELIKPFGVIIRTIGTKIYLMNPSTINIYNLISRSGIRTVPSGITTIDDSDIYQDDIYDASFDIEYEYIFNEHVGEILHSWYSLGRRFDSGNLNLSAYKEKILNTLAPNEALIPNGSKVKKDLSFELKFPSFKKYILDTSTNMIGYTSKPIMRVKVPVLDPDGTAYEIFEQTEAYNLDSFGFDLSFPAVSNPYYTDKKYWIVKVNLSNVPGSSGRLDIVGYGIITNREWDYISGTSVLDIYILFSDSDVQNALLANNSWAFSYEVDAGATATTIPYRSDDYDVGIPLEDNTIRADDQILLYDENMILKSTDGGGLAEPQTVVSVDSNGTVTIASTFNNMGSPVTASEGDIIVLASRTLQTDITSNTYSFFDYPLSIYTNRIT